MEMWRATPELKDCSLEDPEILPTIPSAEMTPPYSHFFSSLVFKYCLHNLSNLMFISSSV